MATFLVTGATSGLGRQVAMRLARLGGNRLILPARDASKAQALRTELLALGAVEVELPVVDLSSLKSVAALTKQLQADHTLQLDGVLFNAGRQSADGLCNTVDGFESTFAVNHLAHHLLLRGLADRVSSSATVGWTASGTHDPREKAARMSGFRGSRYTSAARIARGDYEGATGAQAGRDAYATSKLCNIVAARAAAQGCSTAVNYFSFDPGLMPGTGLAREQGPLLQWVWMHVLPHLAKLLPGTSSTERSSATLTDLLLGRMRGAHNGAYFNYTGEQLEPAAPAKEQWVADDLVHTSDRLLASIV